MESRAIAAENVPYYKVKTPLQRIVQVFKRHAEVMFEQKMEYKPSSIVITTLSTKAYRDINKLEERDLSYKEIQKSNDKFSQSIHLVDGIFITFDLDFAQKYFKNEYTENMKPKMYKISEVLKFGSSAETGEKLLPSTTADGKAILWDEETLKNETGYEFLGWECSYDYKYYNIPFVANYFPADVEYKAVFYEIKKLDISIIRLYNRDNKIKIQSSAGFLKAG